MLAQLFPDRVATHLAQAHVRAADRGQRPWGAPAVAVEHRQSPQINAVLVVPGVDDLAERVQVSTPVGVDHPPRTPRRTRRVIDRDRSKLIRDRPGQRLLRAPGEELRVAHQPRLGGRLRTGRRQLNVLGDHQLSHRLDVVRGSRGRGEQRRVGNHDLRARVLQHVRHFLSRKPGIHRDKHPTRQRNRVMGNEHLGQVRHQVGDPVARLHTARLQRQRHAHGLGRQLRVREPPPAIDHSDLVRPYASRPFQERQRRQRRMRNRTHTDLQGMR